MSAFPVIEDAFTGEVHPYASRWPMRSADELEEMAESIRSRRQRFPIVLTPDGVLVDGRNRLAACTLAGVEPWFEMDPTLTSEEEIGAFIWDANGDRRDMSKGQKAMLAALRPGTAVLLSNTSEVARSFVAKARQVIEWCPAETVESVIDGSLSLNDAYAQAQQVKATEQADGASLSEVKTVAAMLDAALSDYETIPAALDAGALSMHFDADTPTHAEAAS